MKKSVWTLTVLGYALWTNAQTLRTSGTVLVDISAENLSLTDGAAVAQWPNSGTLGGAFAALEGHAGASFTNSLLGKKAVLFDGTDQSVLTNAIAPSSITGKSPCSVETWVWAPTIPVSKASYLSWTADANASTSGDDSRFMLRYDTGNVALDHRGSLLSFGYGIPAAGAWHHIVVTRLSAGTEMVYVDGNFSKTIARSASLEGGRPIALGGVMSYLYTGAYTNRFTGAISRVRIHTGTLSEEDVRFNYLTDAWSYNTADSTTWTGGSGNWNDSANWSDGTAGGAGQRVRIESGAVEITSNVSPGALSAFDVVSGTVTLSVSASCLETQPPFVLGRESGNTAALDLSLGSVTIYSSTGPSVLDMAMDGASSALTLGGGGSSATLSASQVSVFAGEGTADITLKSNGVLAVKAVKAESAGNITIHASGGTFRNTTGAAMGYLFNVPKVDVGANGLVFDAVDNSTMPVSATLTHDPDGPALDGGILKISAGTLRLSGTNTYTGPTFVEAGTLALAPRLLDGLVYRLDASSNALWTLTFDGTGSNVVSWADENGSGTLFTTNKTEVCPAYDATLFGGRGGLRFTRDSTICRLAADRPAPVQTVFAVINPASGNNLGGLWGQSETDYGIRVNSSTIQYAGNENDFPCYGGVYTNGASGNQFTLNQPLVMTAISGSPRTWQTAIGNYWASASYAARGFHGDIAEVLVYDRQFDESEQQTVAHYLMAKWLGTVPSPDFGVPVLPSNAVVRIQQDAALELGGSSVWLASLCGFGTARNTNINRSTLTVGGENTDCVFPGSITGNVAVAKTGTGRVILSGVNTYTGLTRVEAGTLELGSSITSITGLVYRLDASRTDTFTRLADGSNVTVWADAEGSGFTFSTTDDNQCPVYDATLFNGRGGLRFGLGKRMRMVGSASANAQTVFAVNMIRDTSNDNGGFWGKDAADFGLRMGSTTWYWPGNHDDFHWITNGGLVAVNGNLSNATVTVGQPHVVMSSDGSQQTFKPAIGDYWGSSDWPTRYYRGEAAEIIVYDRRLTDVERQTVEAALIAKWFPASAGTVVPQTADVSVDAGATLDLSGNAVTLGSLAGGGLVSNGLLTVTGAVTPEGTLSLPDAPTLTGSLVLSIPAAGTGSSLAVNGDADVSGLTLDVTLPEERPSVTTHTLVTTTGTVTGPFGHNSVSSPWVLLYKPDAIRLVYSAGTVFMLQ